MKEFVVIYLYLVLLIGAFNIYRWLLMAEYHFGYFVYGYTLIEALVLAKVAPACKIGIPQLSKGICQEPCIPANFTPTLLCLINFQSKVNEIGKIVSLRKATKDEEKRFEEAIPD